MSERLISSVVLLWLACQAQASPSRPPGDIPLTPGVAAVADSSDTLFTRRLFALDEVVVTSQRIPRPVLYTPSATSVIPRRLIEQSAGTSLGNVLAAGNGLFVKDYGGPSGIKTISQRGLGTEHTLLLINGMPVNSVQHGGVDLGMTDAAEIERIEIVRGGQSALHGPHAVAGIVNVITRAMPEDEHASAGFEWGSFGYRHLRVAAGSGVTPVAWQIRYGHERSDEQYPFEFRNGPVTRELTRQNADLIVNKWSGGLHTALSPRVRLNSYAAYQDGERGVPGVIAGPYSESRARQRDRQAILQTSVTTVLSPAISWENRVQGLHSYQRYRDPDLFVGYAPVDNYYTSRELRLESHFALQPGSETRFNVGADVARTLGESNAHREDGARTQWAVAFAGEQRLLGADTGASLSLFPALRYDHAGAGLDAWSPQIGVYARVPVGGGEDNPRTLLRARGSGSRNFRPPTFNELYYAGGGGFGNPELRPERSTSIEAGIGASTNLLGEHHVDVTYFAISMSDRIIWMPAGSGSVTPKNIRQVESKGVELAYTFSSGRASVSAQYTRSRSEKTSADYPGDPNTSVQLIYTPQEMFGVRGSWLFNLDAGVLTSVECSGGYTFVGHRYTTEDNDEFLPGYQLVQAGASARFHVGDVRLNVRGDVLNLLDERYEVMAGYPMPPRTVRVRLDVVY